MGAFGLIGAGNMYFTVSFGLIVSFAVYREPQFGAPDRVMTWLALLGTSHVTVNVASVVMRHRGRLNVVIERVARDAVDRRTRSIVA